MAKSKASERAVMICTAKRGVFFGYAADTSGNTVTLERCRMVVYWDQATKGVIGLAAKGPTKGCRITAAAPRAKLREVTAVVDCSDESIAAFEAAPWA